MEQLPFSGKQNVSVFAQALGCVTNNENMGLMSAPLIRNETLILCFELHMSANAASKTILFSPN